MDNTKKIDTLTLLIDSTNQDPRKMKNPPPKKKKNQDGFPISSILIQWHSFCCSADDDDDGDDVGDDEEDDDGDGVANEGNSGPECLITLCLNIQVMTTMTATV